MKYERPKYRQPGIETEERLPMFAREKITVPKLDYPISPVENFKLCYNRQGPRWVPNIGLDFDNLMLGIRARGMPEIDREKRTDYQDAYGVEWTWVPEAGGPMLKPNTVFLDDVTKWREKVVFPDYRGSGAAEAARDFMENTFSPDRVVHVNIGQGCTERLVGILGGYTQFLTALMLEPEACKDFFDAFADYTVGLIDYMFEIYPVIHMVTYHDDWGTEKDTFFSERMMEELLFDATKRIVQRVKERDVCFELHCCGRVERFVPYMIAAGVDMIQIQSRANDIDMLKEKYGDKLGFNYPLLNADPSAPPVTKESLVQIIRDGVDKHASKGGFYQSVVTKDEELTWDGTFEMFCYSREFYDKEQGRA